MAEPCPACGTNVDDAAAFCPTCGHQLKAVVQEVLDRDARYFGAC